jgi:hypothetical protein
MSAPYLLRLICISLASFFLVHLAVGLAVSLVAQWVVKVAGRMPARRAAAFLLAVRLAPACFAAAVVTGLCVPSYLWLEPPGMTEDVGLACLAAALLAAAGFAVSLARSWQAASRSLGYIRYCRLMGRPACLGAGASLAWVVEGGKPFLALAGIVHPRLMVSSGVVAALGAEQLAVALRHEDAHRKSRDNLKRLLVLLAPDLVPFRRSFAALDRAWARFTEWAADDDAVAGDRHRSVSLAAALVRVARLGACPQAPPLVTSLLADNEDLAERVERLLRCASAAADDRGRGWLAACGAILAVVVLTAVQPGTLYSVHRLLEYLTK